MAALAEDSRRIDDVTAGTSREGGPHDVRTTSGMERQLSGAKSAPSLTDDVGGSAATPQSHVHFPTDGDGDAVYTTPQTMSLDERSSDSETPDNVATKEHGSSLRFPSAAQPVPRKRTSSQPWARSVHPARYEEFDTSSSNADPTFREKGPASAVDGTNTSISRMGLNVGSGGGRPVPPPIFTGMSSSQSSLAIRSASPTLDRPSPMSARLQPHLRKPLRQSSHPLANSTTTRPHRAHTLSLAHTGGLSHSSQTSLSRSKPFSTSGRGEGDGDGDDEDDTSSALFRRMRNRKRAQTLLGPYASSPSLNQIGNVGDRANARIRVKSMDTTSPRSPVGNDSRKVSVGDERSPGTSRYNQHPGLSPPAELEPRPRRLSIHRDMGRPTIIVQEDNAQDTGGASSGKGTKRKAGLSAPEQSPNIGLGFEGLLMRDNASGSGGASLGWQMLSVMPCLPAVISVRSPCRAIAQCGRRERDASHMSTISSSFPCAHSTSIRHQVAVVQQRSQLRDVLPSFIARFCR
jgi:hypothetical protein